MNIVVLCKNTKTIYVIDPAMKGYQSCADFLMYRKPVVKEVYGRPCLFLKELLVRLNIKSKLR